MTVMTLSIDCTACIVIPDFYSIRYYVSNEWCPNVDSRKGSEIYSKHFVIDTMLRILHVMMMNHILK